MDQNKIKEEYKLLRDQLELFKLFIYNSEVINENNPYYSKLISKIYDLEHMIHLSFNFESNFENMEQEHKESIKKTICSNCKHDLIYHREDNYCSYESCNCALTYNNVLEISHETIEVKE
jgi:hypothetical protein